MLNVFDIQRGSFHDGPGIRTVVFLKGCNMSCFWCQNPESQKSGKEILYYENLCRGCQKCIEVCPMHCRTIRDGRMTYNRGICTHCERCVEICNTTALQTSGQMMDVKDVMAEVLQDQDMYRISGGGMTVSGGEPLLQSEECVKLLKLAKEYGIHTAVETAGAVKWNVFEEILPYLDMIYLDIKIFDSDSHRKHCGIGNEMVLENAEKLIREEIPVIIRTPVIPGINDTEENIRSIARFLRPGKNVKYELLPFHRLGDSKYTALDRVYPASSLQQPAAEKMETLMNSACAEGVSATVG